MIKYRQIAHAAYKVKDLEQSVAFYCQCLGLKEKFRLEDTREADPDKRMCLVYLEVVPGQFIELFKGVKGLADSDKSDDHFGYLHLSLEVEDIREAKRVLEDKGVKILSDISLGIDHTYQMWIADPDGNRIEMMEYTSESLQTK